MKKAKRHITTQIPPCIQNTACNPIELTAIGKNWKKWAMENDFWETKEHSMLHD